MLDVWTETLRVLKPGGLICAWALPKTSDLASLAMRLAGFTVQDMHSHIFSEGMNKSGCIGKQIDKAAGAVREVVGKHPNPNGQRGGTTMGAGWSSDVDITAPATEAAKRWTGWHSQVAPGCEFWIIAQATGRLVYAEQLPTHGTGAFNIDACRIPRGEGEIKPGDAGCWASETSYGPG